MTKKWNVALMGIGAACMLIAPAAALNAAPYLDKSEMTDRNGQPLLVETYTLPIGEDPDQLIKEPFDVDGIHYVHEITQTQEMHPMRNGCRKSPLLLKLKTTICRRSSRHCP